MDAVDGNAIGGLLQEVFGSEMPTVRICGTRGTAARSASLPSTRMRRARSSAARRATAF
jgi:hypothetical protein